MNIAIAQLNYHIGNFESNFNKISNAISKAVELNAKLIIFSELAITGYPPLDLLEQKDFIDESNKVLQKLIKLSNKIAIIVGAPIINTNTLGKKLFNTAAFLNKGKIASLHKKTLLPTYDIFDEYRYFEPNNEFSIAELDNYKFAITICEDLWDNQPVENSFAKEKLYNSSPMDKLIQYQPDFIINIAASPFSYSQEGVRKQVLSNNAKKYNLPIIYANQVGAQTEIVFDGGSLVMNSNGEVIKKLSLFSEDFLVFNTNETEKQLLIKEDNKPIISKIHDALVLGIKDYFAKMSFSKATLGLSGGIDSAVTLVLAVEALGSENVRVLLLPSEYSSEHSITDAVKLAENLNIQYNTISIQNTFKIFKNDLNEIFNNMPEDITEENIQARIRGVMLMALSNKFGHILLNTSNKSEAAVGYGTLYGDMNGGLSVLGDVYKTDVYQLAHYINSNAEIIPENIITKPPSAELRPNQIDQDTLPDYEILDKILFHFIEQKLSRSEIEKKGFDKNTIDKIIGMVNRSEYKRFQTPPIIRISSKAFGYGRRIPLVARY